VGGTLTILCYGYWIQEKGRFGPEEIKTCRIDLAVGYFMTVLFGLAMVIIGSTIQIEGQGAGLLTSLARQLEAPLGLVGRWLFLVGAFGAVFSSLLGVWQSVPYLFADIWGLFFTSKTNTPRADIAKSPAYRVYLWAITLLPMAGLFMSFKDVQKFYAVIGATFIPLLALGLLVLNGRRAWVGVYVNRPLTILILVVCLTFFGIIGFLVDVG
jgi:hypothetical protein